MSKAKSLKPKVLSRQRLYQIRHEQQNLCHLDSRPALGSDVKYGWFCMRHAQQHAARHNRKYRKWTVADKALFLELWQEGVRGRTLALLFDISEGNVLSLRCLWKLQPRRKGRPQ